MNIRYKISIDKSPLKRGDLISCIIISEGGICEHNHYGHVVTAEPEAENIIVRFKGRNFTEVISRNAVKRMQ